MVRQGVQELEGQGDLEPLGASAVVGHAPGEPLRVDAGSAVAGLGVNAVRGRETGQRQSVERQPAGRDPVRGGHQDDHPAPVQPPSAGDTGWSPAAPDEAPRDR